MKDITDVEVVGGQHPEPDTSHSQSLGHGFPLQSRSSSQLSLDGRSRERTVEFVQREGDGAEMSEPNSYSEGWEHAFTISNNHYADGVVLLHTRPEVLLRALSKNPCKS
jgi:hypothetical protein